MSAPLLADVEAIAALAEAMTGFGERAARTRSELDAVDARLRAGWGGGAADARAEDHHRWAPAALEMSDAVAALHRLVRTAAGNYGAAVTANEGMWG